MFDRHCQCSHCMCTYGSYTLNQRVPKDPSTKAEPKMRKTILRVNKNKSYGFEVKQPLPSHFNLQRDMDTSSLVFN